VPALTEDGESSGCESEPSDDDGGLDRFSCDVAPQNDGDDDDDDDEDVVADAAAVLS